jgi:penicillin-binding protein 2
MKFDARDGARYEQFTRRVAMLSLGSLGVFGVLASRMYYLQVIEGEQYQTMAEDNRINRRLLTPLRGRILDRFGVELASNTQNFQVLLIAEDTDDLDGTLDAISKIVPLSDARRKRITREVRRKRKFVPVTISENLSWEQFAQINIQAPNLPGILADAGDVRNYPYKDRLAHVIGYVAKATDRDVEDNDDPLLQLPGFRIGKSGLEKSVDLDLRGSAGTSHVEVNAYGRVIKEVSRKEGNPGKNMVLTLDMGLQEFIYKRLEGKSAAVVVMDVKNGDLLGFAATPAYDPNDFTRGLSQEKWDALRTNEMDPLVNKTIAGQFSPGSTFKIISALAGLESGVINPAETVYCGGKIRLGRREFHCWKRHGHGHMNLRNAIKNSCNVYFFEMAKRMGITDYSAMGKKFGIGELHDIGIPGTKAGLMPSDNWKRAFRDEPWVKGDTLNTAIGQGFLLVTPLHQAVMTARLASGGFAIKPRLIRSLGELETPLEAPESLGLQKRWVNLVREGMIAVVNEPGGTAFGKRLRGEGLSMAGKTGTVQIRRITKQERAAGVIKNEDLPWRRRDHGWFVGFGPTVDPRYAVAVLVEHGGGGSSAAAPVGRDVMREVLLRDPSRRPTFDPIAFQEQGSKAGEA